MLARPRNRAVILGQSSCFRRRLGHDNRNNRYHPHSRVVWQLTETFPVAKRRCPDGHPDLAFKFRLCNCLDQIGEKWGLEK